MRKCFSVLALLATSFSTISQTFAAPDPNFHIYLAFGQSNMEGAGPVEAQDKTPEKRFQLLSAFGGCHGRQVGQWTDAVPPLANCNGQLGPVDYFGRTLVKKLPEQIKVGVSVVAIAGCDIQLFEKDNYKSYNPASWMQNTIQGYGGNPYGRLIEMGKKAQEVGVIKGILLHQGETNSGQQNWPNRVKAIYDNIIKDLGLNADQVPLLAGEVVPTSAGGSCGGMNAIIQKLPSVIKNAHVISAEGLKSKGDNLHFNSADYRKFGERYAETMLKLLGDVSAAPATNEQAPANNNQAPANNNPAPAPANNNPAPAPANNNPAPAPANDNPAPVNNPNLVPGNVPATTPATGGECWSKNLGFDCCTNKSPVLYTDKDGQWGVENGKWCGLTTSKSGCWAESLGFKCCSTSGCRKAVYFDYDGQWDVENGQWCGISTSNVLC